MKKKILDIVVRKDLYPRFEVDQRKVQEYSENIERLPPIVINQDNILIDGLHRIKAHKESRLTEIEAKVEQTKSDDEIYLRAIELNATHGLQLSYKDKQSIAVKLYDGKNSDRLIKALSISQQCFSVWTKNKRQSLEKELKETIINLYLKCKTQQDIAKLTNLSEARISQILKDFLNNTKNSKIKEMSEFQPFLYNIWKQSKINNETKHFGNFPIEFMENLLYYYTKPFDVVYDPFAGGGVTIDACKKWFRRYYVSDLNPTPSREEDIMKWDITKGLPDKMPTPNFVFLDPPYWKQAENKYSKDKEDLANMSLDDFYGSLLTLVSLLKKKMKGGYVAFVIQPTQWKNNYVWEDHIIRIIEIFKSKGFEVNMRINLPYSTEQYNAQMVDIAKDKKILLSLYRDLVIFKLKTKEA